MARRASARASDAPSASLAVISPTRMRWAISSASHCSYSGSGKRGLALAAPARLTPPPRASSPRPAPALSSSRRRGSKRLPVSSLISASSYLLRWLGTSHQSTDRLSRLLGRQPPASILLGAGAPAIAYRQATALALEDLAGHALGRAAGQPYQIGRASCRERGEDRGVA